MPFVLFLAGFRAPSARRVGGWRGRAVLLALPLLLPLLGGCNLINPAEPVPAYLHIRPFQYVPGVADAPATQYALDATVYANNLLLGTFDLPATIPVLASGATQITVYPSIFADGQRTLRFPYPFYAGLDLPLDLKPGQTTRIEPTLAYTARTQFAFKADFQSANALGFSLTPVGRPRYQLLVTDADSLAGSLRGSGGKVGLVLGRRDTTTSFFLESDFNGTLPQRGRPVYAELDYRCTMAFRVGVVYTPDGGGAPVRVADLTVYPKREWTKLYVSLIDEVSNVNLPATLFRLSIEGLPTGAPGEYLALDNVRLVREQ